MLLSLFLVLFLCKVFVKIFKCLNVLIRFFYIENFLMWWVRVNVFLWSFVLRICICGLIFLFWFMFINGNLVLFDFFVGLYRLGGFCNYRLFWSLLGGMDLVVVFVGLDLVWIYDYWCGWESFFILVIWFVIYM